MQSFSVVVPTPDCITVSVTNHTYSSTPRLFSDSFLYAMIFYQSLIDADFFTSEIGPDILMNVLEDCIIFLIWAACVLLSFSLKQEQVFLV